MPKANATDNHSMPSPALPCNTTQLEGHSHAYQMVQAMYDNNTMPNGYIIAGQRGIGKATFAYHVARYMLAGGKQNYTTTPPDHPLFQRIASGGHTDLLTIQAGLNPLTGKTSQEITVDQIRRISGFLSVTSSEGGYRIVIIDSADDMNTNAANALLKWLEEPPSNTLFILISHAIGQLLPTIRSRCQLLKLQAPSLEQCHTILQRFTDDISQEDIKQLLTLACHSPGLAIELYHNQALAIIDDIESIIAQPFHMALTRIHSLADSMHKKEENKRWQIFCYVLRWYLHQAILQHAKPNYEARESVDALASKYTLEKLFQLWENVTALLKSADHKNLDKKAIIIAVFEKLKHE